MITSGSSEETIDMSSEYHLHFLGTHSQNKPKFYTIQERRAGFKPEVEKHLILDG